MSVRSLVSPSKSRNPAVVEVLREHRESNLAWIERVLTAKLVPAGAEWSLLLLVGGNDPLSFRLRVAQSHVRHDLSPSAWSHVSFIPGVGKDPGTSRTIEVSLAPPDGFAAFGYPPPTNGIQEGTLREYASAARFPNIALLSVPVACAEIATSLEALRFQRSTLDVPQLVLRWLSYGWGIGVPASPLGEGYGMPSAAALEVAFAARGFDLTPGLESRSSCPEAIWQAAAWWHEYYAKVTKHPFRGAYSAKHDLVPDDLYGKRTPEPAPPQRKARRRKRRR